jgi:hypothetical protein
VGILPRRVLAFIVYQATPRDPLVLAAFGQSRRQLFPKTHNGRFARDSGVIQ